MRRLFKDSHHEIFEELHSSKNQHVDFSKVFENSGLKVWWQCPANTKHVYRQPVTSRTQKNYGCPYCSGRRTLPEESFAALYPKLAAELHPTKNNKLDPTKYSPNSNKIAWWVCPEGHEWKANIVERVRRNRTCKTCRGYNNSFGIKHPDIANEWHPVRNKPLTPFDVLPSYTKKVWWKCPTNPSHEWQVRVSTRAFSKSACPKCSKESLKEGRLPPLSEYSPELASQWHPTKNGGLKPSEVTAGSSQKAWWICPNDSNHEWPATVSNRAIQGKNCPKCCYRSAAKPENSLAIRFPDIAKECHPTRNGEISPFLVSYGSSRKIWWQCTRDNSHEWEEKITFRTHKKNPTCPKCLESRTSNANSLQQLFPEIASEWHPTKNQNLQLDNISRASGKRVWWLCSKNNDHEWEAQVKNRTVVGSGCPDCALERNRIRLQEHLFDVAYLDIDFYHNFLSHINTLRELTELDTKKNKNMNQPFLRMIYASVITSLETYLCDAFYKKVTNSNELMEKFVRKNKEFSERKYSLDEIIDWKDNLKNRITDYIFSKIMWHNLTKVENHYKNVLLVNFNGDLLISLLIAINIRHDIVHRNGKTINGSIHKISRKQVISLIDEVKEFVDFVNIQIMKIAEQKY